MNSTHKLCLTFILFWMADLLLPSWPHHVIHSLLLSLGNSPAGRRAAGPPPGALWECRLRAISLGCHRVLFLCLNNLLEWGLQSKELLGALQENASAVVPPLPCLSSRNIHAYRYIIVHKMQFGILPRLDYLLLFDLFTGSSGNLIEADNV